MNPLLIITGIAIAISAVDQTGEPLIWAQLIGLAMVLIGGVFTEVSE